MTTWHICCPGPTLDWAALGDPGGKIICINMGLIGAPRADYWCCIDRPNAVHETCVEDFHRLKPLLLTKKKRFPNWQKLLGDVLLENAYARQGFSIDWVQRSHSGTTFSVFTATAYAVAAGATEIVYHGVSLGGVGYQNGRNPKRERKGTPEKADAGIWKKRWPREIACWRKLWEGSKGSGVELRGLPVVVTGAKASTESERTIV